MTEQNHWAFSLQNVRKSYGARIIPRRLFRECRIPEEVGGVSDWRSVCGSKEVCWLDCPKCWTLWVENMNIPIGKSVAILGHSGAGKSTLLNILGLLDSPDSDLKTLRIGYRDADGDIGQFEFEDRRWRSGGKTVDDSTIRRKYFGFVFQSGHLTPNLTARQNVALAMSVAGFSKSERDERATELLDVIGFPHRRARALPRHLSGGEYQRVAVARAIAHRPQVVFADEPTGNLDPVTGDKVMSLLAQWRTESAGTLVLVTHNVEHAIEYCDHIYVFSSGRLTLDAPANKVSADKIKDALRPKDWG